jgi:hypothetical protein
MSVLAVTFDAHIRVAEGTELHRIALPAFSAALAEAESRQRGRRVADAARYAEAVSCLLANVATVQLAAPGLALAVRRRERDGGRVASDPSVYGNGLNAAVIAGERAGLFTPGRVGFYSVCAPTDKLLAMLPPLDVHQVRVAGDLPSILLRGVKCKYGRAPALSFEPAEVARELQEMTHMNAWLAGLQIEILDGSAWTVATHDPRLVRVASRHHRTCTRIFTGGTFAHGGRLYRPYWLGMTKAERFARLRIDGEPIAEVDYRAMFLRLAYRAAGALWPFDGDEDGYAPPGVSDEERSGLKAFTNAFLHGLRGRQFPADVAANFASGTRPSDVAAAIRSRHPALDRAGFLGSNIGHQLTRMESNLMVALLLRCRDLGVSALGVHDALLVPASRADQAQEIMESSAAEYLGCELPARVRLGA